MSVIICCALLMSPNIAAIVVFCNSNSPVTLTRDDTKEATPLIERYCNARPFSSPKTLAWAYAAEVVPLMLLFKEVCALTERAVAAIALCSAVILLAVAAARFSSAVFVLFFAADNASSAATLFAVAAAIFCSFTTC